MHRATTVHLCGELDIATVEQVRRDLAAALAGGSADVVVDLRAVTFLDAATVGALAWARCEAQAEGRRLVLSGLSPRLARVLRLLGVQSEFETTG